MEVSITKDWLSKKKRDKEVITPFNPRTAIFANLGQKILPLLAQKLQNCVAKCVCVERERLWIRVLKWNRTSSFIAPRIRPIKILDCRSSGVNGCSVYNIFLAGMFSFNCQSMAPRIEIVQFWLSAGSVRVADPHCGWMTRTGFSFLI